MDERRATPRHRTLIGGKIVFNSGRSAIDCTIRNLTKAGACLQVQSPIGIPDHFYLRVAESDDLRACTTAWKSTDRIGVSFDQSRSTSAPGSGLSEAAADALTTFRTAFDHVDFGVVLLDRELCALFINRTFRKMFRVPDAKAESNPPFVALMYHGRDTQAYEVPTRDIDRYVADRVAHVKAGNPSPIDIRMADGEVLRFQCAVLPTGGRMLSYTYVTDIVRFSDELQTVHAALDRVRNGITLVDADLSVRFMNTAARRLWNLEQEPTKLPNLVDLVSRALTSETYGVNTDDLPEFVSRRIAQIRRGDPTPIDLHLSDGRVVRAVCDQLPSGGRMLTYSDVTDLTRNIERMRLLATTDSMTGLFNRRQFLNLAEVEWARFQRYHRPLSLFVIDIDDFKSINDRFGHDIGDGALREVARLLQEGRRVSDIVARLGGDEFVLLLPETDAARATTLAERLCAAVRDKPMAVDGRTFNVTFSIGAAEAAASMSDVAGLMKAADEALYQAKAEGRNRFVIAQSPADHVHVAAE